MKKLAIGLFAATTIALMFWGYYQAIYVAPDDAMQGYIFRIIYYHVPSASVAFLFFAISLLGSIGFLAFRRNYPERAQIADAWALAGAEVGVIFCTVVLTTGPLWGRRAWGIWWTWDARLTTTLVLWLIYVSYLLLRRFAAGPQMQTLAAVLGIFGALDVPIVYMSNRWWRTQHPAPVFGGASGSGMAASMVGALLWNMLAWFCWGVLILLLRYNVERKHQMNAAAEAQEALEANV
ncbi:MAG: cytochrome c biogenesis protein CcsA [Terracidiphilus sp.]